MLEALDVAISCFSLSACTLKLWRNWKLSQRFIILQLSQSWKRRSRRSVWLLLPQRWKRRVGSLFTRYLGESSHQSSHMLVCLFHPNIFFFNLRSTLILIKPTLLGLKKRFLIQDRVWETASSVFPGSVCFSSSEGKRYLVLWIGEAWFRGSDRSIEWAMWGWLSKAVLRGPEVIRQTSKSGYFQYLDENPLLPGRHCPGADRMDSGLEEYWISSSSNCLESL